MSSMYFVADEHVEKDASFTNLAWACTGCEACKNSCDHKNPVADTLGAARAALFAEGKAPPAAVRVAQLFAARKAELGQRVAQAKARHGLPDTARIGILAGCTYMRRLPEVADHVIASAARLVGTATLVGSCCGSALGMAGDREGQRHELTELAQETRGMRLLVVGDPGCAYAIKKGIEAHGIALDPRVITLVELAAEHVIELTRIPGETPVFHDPCHLGRGLGLTSEPRAILTRLFGEAPYEMVKNREHGSCSGGGGLLPLIMPEIAGTIARDRAAEAGGRLLVTACAQSLRSFRKAGARAEDLATLVARGLGVAE
jgi:Fe-S oxidoreductase